MRGLGAGWRDVWLVALREIRVRGRGRAYRVTTVLAVLLVVGIVVLPTLVGQDAERPEVRVGIVGEAPAGFEETLRAIAEAQEVDLMLERFADREAAEEAIRAGDVEVVVLDGRVALVERDIDVGFGFGAIGGSSGLDLVLQAARAVNLQRLAAEVGLPPERIVEVVLGDPLQIEALEPVDETQGARQAVAYAGLLLLYISVLTYGQWTLTGVLEEKTNRVVEVLLAAVRPRRLMAGKVIGIGILGLIQIALVVIAGLTAAQSTGAIDLFDLPASAFPSLIAWYLLGYALYAAAFAAIGSVIARIEEAQTTATPLTLFVVVAFFAAITALTDPTGLVPRIATWLPFTAPFVVPVRQTLDAIAWWEVAGAVLSTVVGAWVMVRVAGRLYVGGILHTRSRIGFRQAWRSAEL